MGTTEIKVESEEIQKSVKRMQEIRTRLKICEERKLLLEESAGETAEKTKAMYEEVLYVAGAMRELVDQTIMLAQKGEEAFLQADQKAAGMFSTEK